MSKVKVLIVDDSSAIRFLMKKILEQDHEIDVIGFSRDGKEALSKISELKPDVITLDINMPVMDGIECLERIMLRNPLPVVMVSALTTKDADITIHALELGAIDFITKPDIFNRDDLIKNSEIICKIIKKATKANVSRKRVLNRTINKNSCTNSTIPNIIAKKVVVIGASTGGPKCISFLLSKLPQNLKCAVMIVQHIPIGFAGSFAERLNEVSPLKVNLVIKKEKIFAGQVYLASSGKHMIAKKINGFNGCFVDLEENPINTIHKPSVDVLFTSAANVFRANCLGILLTGMGKDGSQGLLDIKNKHGKTVAESEESCTIFGMPKAAIDLNAVDQILNLDEIIENILNF